MSRKKEKEEKNEKRKVEVETAELVCPVCSEKKGEPFKTTHFCHSILYTQKTGITEKEWKCEVCGHQHIER